MIRIEISSETKALNQAVEEFDQRTNGRFDRLGISPMVDYALSRGWLELAGRLVHRSHFTPQSHPDLLGTMFIHLND